MSVAAIALAAGALLSTLVPFPLPDVVMAGPFLLVLLCAAERDTRPVGGWLRARALVFTGEASFALYLVHEAVILNLAPMVDLPAHAEAAVVVAVCVVVAGSLHLLVEQPANRLLRGGGRSVALAAPADIAPADDDTPLEPPR